MALKLKKLNNIKKSKKLTLAEAQQYLPESKICQILSDILVHEGMEQFLNNPSKHPPWKAKKQIIIFNTRGEFSNENWIYYLEKFVKLQPKILTFDTSDLSDILGIEKIESLEEFNLLEGCEESRPSIVAIEKILAQLLVLPNIKKISMKYFFQEGGSGRAHDRCVDACLQQIIKVFPQVKLVEGGGIPRILNFYLDGKGVLS